jgi:hypothetical protein
VRRGTSSPGTRRSSEVGSAARTVPAGQERRKSPARDVERPPDRECRAAVRLSRGGHRLQQPAGRARRGQLIRNVVRPSGRECRASGWSGLSFGRLIGDIVRSPDWGHRAPGETKRGLAGQVGVRSEKQRVSVVGTNVAGRNLVARPDRNGAGFRGTVASSMQYGVPYVPGPVAATILNSPSRRGWVSKLAGRVHLALGADRRAVGAPARRGRRNGW